MYRHKTVESRCESVSVPPVTAAIATASMGSRHTIATVQPKMDRIRGAAPLGTSDWKNDVSATEHLASTDVPLSYVFYRASSPLAFRGAERDQ